MKTERISARVTKEIKDKFIRKCNQIGISESQFIEKIAKEDLIFLDGNAKKLIKFMVAK